MSSPKKSNGLGGWTLKDEAKFVNGLGSFIGGQASQGTVLFLLDQYRKAVEKRPASTLNFSKPEVLALIDARIDQLTWETTPSH